MNRQIATILAFIVAVLPAYIGAGEDPPEENAQQRNESDAVGKTFFVRLADGSEIEVASIRISSGYVMLTLPNGGQVAYTIGDVDLESLPWKPETKAMIDVEAPRRLTGLSKYASELITDYEATWERLDAIEFSPWPTPVVSPEGSTYKPETENEKRDREAAYLERVVARDREEHIRALEQYEEQIQQLADLGMEAARAWNRASAACAGGTSFGGQGYGIIANSWESWTVDVSYNGWIDNSSTPACRAMVADAEGLASALASGLNQMGGVARKSGVLPGEARRIMNSYGFRN